MLVLSRRPQQSLLIGHDVIITVLEVNGDTVRIGISAPPEVQIHREEVYRDLQASNREAAARPGASADLARRLKNRTPKGAGTTSTGPAASSSGPGSAKPGSPGAKPGPGGSPRPTPPA